MMTASWDAGGGYMRSVREAIGRVSETRLTRVRKAWVQEEKVRIKGDQKKERKRIAGSCATKGRPARQRGVEEEEEEEDEEYEEDDDDEGQAEEAGSAQLRVMETKRVSD
jgi:hypothetical protein